MERLTINKETSEMSVIELAYNSCYAKDKKARYRDYETDIDARELVIKLLEEHADIPNEFTCGDDFDDFMLDSLQYGTDDMLGLIAVFYRNLCAMSDLRERLKYYEDLEEQGKLLKLPCAIGDTVYDIIPADILNPHPKKLKIRENQNVDLVYIAKRFGNFGKTTFLTREEAETALQKMNKARVENEERVQIHIYVTGQDTTATWELKCFGGLAVKRFCVLSDIEGLVEFCGQTRVRIDFYDGTSKEAIFRYIGFNKLEEIEFSDLNFWERKSEATDNDN